MIRCIFIVVLIINLVLCEGEKDVKLKLEKKNQQLNKLIHLLESNTQSSRKAKGIGFNLKRFLEKFKKVPPEESRQVIPDNKFLDDDYEDDPYTEADYELRQANPKLEDEYYDDDDEDKIDEDDSFLNDDDPRSDDPRHFLKKKFLMLKNLWAKKKINNTLINNSSTISASNNDIPTFTTFITLPASALVDSPIAEPLENDENINTGTPTGTGTGTGTITAETVDFVPEDLPEDSILPNIEVMNINSNDPDRPDHNSENKPHVVNAYGSRAQTEKQNSSKPNSERQFEIIEEEGDFLSGLQNQDELNDNSNNDEMVEEEKNQLNSINAEKHKLYLQQHYIQQQIQKQLYEIQLQQDKKEKKRKRKRKKKRPVKPNEDDNTGIAYYTKYLPPNLRKLMQIRPTVYLRGKAKNDAQKKSRKLSIT